MHAPAKPGLPLAAPSVPLFLLCGHGTVAVWTCNECVCTCNQSPRAPGCRESNAGAVPRRAFRWLTTVVSIKTLPAGSCVGYECAARCSHAPSPTLSPTDPVPRAY